ncbi:hypothetical protein KQX54_016244 [Cotesia glomerata]|uniref:Uncharacterized protein n=1 Tax=Cotesia glomerata TaxID=32391 RepID=A0AAV7ITU0_COTGL|nr:hypothetical protein KQX54_016244 [Cotesia glomerata]
MTDVQAKGEDFTRLQSSSPRPGCIAKSRVKLEIDDTDFTSWMENSMRGGLTGPWEFCHFWLIINKLEGFLLGFINFLEFWNFWRNLSII